MTQTIPDHFDHALAVAIHRPGRRVFCQFDPARHEHDYGRGRVVAFDQATLRQLAYPGAFNVEPTWRSDPGGGVSRETGRA